jgi:hypothetical protein
MADAILSANLAALSRWDPALAEAIRVATDGSPLRLTPSRAGDLTASYRGVQLHSRYDPRKEAERIIAEFAPGATCIVLGFGAGWIPEVVSEKSPATVTVVFEPSRAALRDALMERDFRGPFEGGAIRLATTTEELRAVLRRVHLPAVGDGVTLHPLSGRGESTEDEEIFAAARRTIRLVLEEIAAELGTIRRFAVPWLAHTLTNSYSFSWGGTSDAVRGLAGILASTLPRTVAGAGPSLTGEALSDRPEGPLVAVDTALPALMKLGFPPDIVVSIDPQGWSSLHFRRRLPERTILVADIGVTPRVITTAPRTVLMSSNHPLHRLMERHGFPLLSPLDGIETVSEMAISLAGSTGSPLQLIGMDGAYPHGETYAPGTYHHTLAHQRGRRLSSVETFFARSVYSRAPAPLPDGANRPVFAPPAMAAARERIHRLASSPRSNPLRLPSEAPPPEPREFWHRHAAELREAADRLSRETDLSTPRIIAAIGPHGVAHLPILAALRHRLASPTHSGSASELPRAIAAGGCTAVAAALRTAARLVDPEGSPNGKQVLLF